MTWILPTKRPKNLKRFLNSAREMGTEGPGLIVINRSDWQKNEWAYQEIKALAPNGWQYEIVDADCYGEAIRQVWPKVRNDFWIGLVSDDLLCCTSNWDKRLIAKLTGWNVVYSNDGWQAPARMHGAIVWSGDLARAVGWIFPEGFRHIFHDDVWETLARESGCATYEGDVLLKHDHESRHGIKGPTMDPSSDLWKHDQAAFNDWLRSDKEAVVERIRSHMAKHNIRTMKPDWKGKSIFIATPSADGHYESNFVVSLWRTMQMLATNGVSFQFAEEKYTADIALARSKLFAAFVRSGCTHMLTIDADMGWGDDAVVRLICANKDFVSVAGPKKRYPLSFAANYTDDRGIPVNLQFDIESGTMEIGEIGSAFCLISRTCAEKMIKAYPELEYEGVTAEREWGFYIPMVQRRRWYSEDFAFCKRWRNIGGRCYFVPDVRLKHTGMHTFEGSFSETIKPAAAQEAADD